MRIVTVLVSGVGGFGKKNWLSAALKFVIE